MKDMLHLIDGKMAVILDAFLPFRLADGMIPAVSDRIGSLDIRIGISPDSSYQEALDRLPRVDIYPTGSVLDDETIGWVNAEIAYEIAATVQYDVGGPEWSAKSAIYLAAATAEILEKYMPDSVDLDDRCVWDAVTTSAISTQPNIPNFEKRHLTRATSTISFKCRWPYEREATSVFTIPSPSGRGPLTPSGPLYVRTGGGAELAKMDVAAKQALLKLSLVSGDVAFFDASSAYGWPSGTRWGLYTPGGHKDGELDPSDTVTVDLNEVPPRSGDTWILRIEAPSGASLTWAVRWTN